MTDLEELSALLPASGQACDWPVSYIDCGGECTVYSRWGEGADQAQAVFEQMAADWLWNATGGLFGVCDVEMRPCRQGCSGNADWASTFWGRGPGFDPSFPRLGGGTGGGAFYPVLVSGQWYNVTCGCLGGCSCDPSGPQVLSLPGPAQSVTEVTVDGVIVPPSSYRLDRNRWLIRTDGGVWPGCQDMNAADDAVGSFVVRYKRGVTVPVTGQVAAGRLACEMARQACGDPNCGLPDNWTTLARQGITVSRDPSSSDGPAETGIWSIDNWVKQMNQPRPIALVRSPDYRR